MCEPHVCSASAAGRRQDPPGIIRFVNDFPYDPRGLPVSRAFLPYGRHAIDADDVAAVIGVFGHELLTTGPAVAAFERVFAERVGARHALACSSGTAALHLAVLALGLGPGDAAVVPTLTFLATANAVRFTGAEVVFADVDPRTGLIGAAHLAAALGRAAGSGLRVRAVLPVDLNGQPCDLPPLAALAREHRLTVIEDACHALGGSAVDAAGVLRPVGACAAADLACFSLHPVKVVTMGEGGVVTTNDDGLAGRVARMRIHGMTRDPAAFENAELAFDADGTPNPWYYEMAEVGYNYRVSDLNCALGTSQMARLGQFVARRRFLADLYDRLLAPLAPALRPVPRVVWGDSGWHLYVVQIDFAGLGISRARVMARLRQAGIGSQVHYLPVHLQPYYRRRYGEIDLPGARAYYDRVLSLPLFPAMTEEDVARVAAALAAIVGSGPAEG